MMNKIYALYGLAIVLILVGVIWILQGANILPGSFMTGQPEWFVAGVVTLIVGVLVGRYARKQQQAEADSV